MCKCRHDEDFYEAIEKLKANSALVSLIKDAASIYKVMGLSKEDAILLLRSDIIRALENPW